MRALLVGDDGLLVEVASGRRPRPSTRNCCAAAREGLLTVREIVPAARTVLLDGLTDPARLASELTTSDVPPLPHARVRSSNSRCVTTARTSPTSPPCGGVPEREVARIHAATEFRVAFCGFAPGFGYLTGLPARYDVPAGPLRARPCTPVPWVWRARTRACIPVRRPAVGS